MTYNEWIQHIRNERRKIAEKREQYDAKPVLPAVLLSTGHKIDFQIGQTVYLKMDNEQHGRMITGISLRPNRSVTYCLAFGTTETWHYGIEIDDERDIVKATTG